MTLNELINEVGVRLSLAHDAIERYNNLGFAHVQVTLARTKIEEAGGYLQQAQEAVTELLKQRVVTATVSPTLTTVGGVNFALAAPLNPAYMPSAEQRLYGSQMGTFVGDPGVPSGARSPQGFPTANGVVLFNGATFANDVAVAAYVEAMKQSAINATPVPGSYVPNGA